MTAHLTRRALLGGAMAAVAGVALAEAPQRALRPRLRGEGAGQAATAAARAPLADLIAAAQLGGSVGVLLADARSGAVIEEHEAGAAMPPASVTKAITALYALGALGSDHRFETRLLATGPVAEGVLQGDLILAGGGDPVLGTDQMADLAVLLRNAGVRSVAGGFRVWGGAIPAIAQIDPGQLGHLGYNPAVGGLNLNFNRVHFEWARQGGNYRVTMDARTDRYRPDVSIARMRVADRDLPVYTYSGAEGVDDWTVARSALGDGGARWLPVRRPALYAGDVFRTMAAAQGIALPAAQEIASLPGGTITVARLQSDRMSVLLRDMLNFSTNLTAEVLGLTATAARGGNASGLAASARAMTGWARQALGVEARFVDHSGLGDASRISAAQMVRALVAAGPDGALRALLKDIPLTDADGKPLRNPPAQVVAKTGTLNFVSALAGYLRTAGGRDLVFAIFTVDPDRRARAIAAQDEVPEGARGWNQRARRLQQQLLQRWGAV